MRITVPKPLTWGTSFDFGGGERLARLHHRDLLARTLDVRWRDMGPKACSRLRPSASSTRSERAGASNSIPAGKVHVLEGLQHLLPRPPPAEVPPRAYDSGETCAPTDGHPEGLETMSPSPRSLTNGNLAKIVRGQPPDSLGRDIGTNLSSFVDRASNKFNFRCFQLASFHSFLYLTTSGVAPTGIEPFSTARPDVDPPPSASLFGGDNGVR